MTTPEWFLVGFCVLTVGIILVAIVLVFKHTR